MSQTRLARIVGLGERFLLINVKLFLILVEELISVASSLALLPQELAWMI